MKETYHVFVLLTVATFDHNYSNHSDNKHKIVIKVVYNGV